MSKYEVRVKVDVLPYVTYYYVQYRPVAAFVIGWRYHFARHGGAEFRTEQRNLAVEEAKRLKEMLNRPEPESRYIYV